LIAIALGGMALLLAGIAAVALIARRYARMRSR